MKKFDDDLEFESLNDEPRDTRFILPIIVVAVLLVIVIVALVLLGKNSKNKENNMRFIVCLIINSWANILLLYMIRYKNRSFKKQHCTEVTFGFALL